MGSAPESEMVETAAEALRDAARLGRPIDPVSGMLGTTNDVDLAYAVQLHNTERAIADGRRITGRKIGLTSHAVQQQLGVDRPDYGVLFADMEVVDGGVVPAEALLQPRAEAEVALVLGRDLDRAPHTVLDVVRAVEFALPAIEIVDSRIRDWEISLVDTIADNASSGCYVVGTQPRSLSEFEISTVPMRLLVNGTEAAVGDGSQCLGNPLIAARWLADVMCDADSPLIAGDVLMTGALGPMHSVSLGDQIHASFGPLGDVRCTLENAT